MEAEDRSCLDWRVLLDEWAQDARLQQRSDRYIAQVRAIIGRLMAFAETEDIHAIDRQTIRRHLSGLSECGVRGRPTTPKTLNNYLATYRAFFEWCKRSERARASWPNPCDGLKPARTTTKEGRAFTAQEAQAIYLAALTDERSDKPRSPKIRSPLYRLLSITGLRIGAARTLRVRHFELDRSPAVLFIPGTRGKESRERELVIPEPDRLFFIEAFKGKHPDDLAFENPTQNTLRLDARLAGVPAQDGRGRGVGFHCFRRFVGTELDRMGVSTKIIQNQLGHRSAQTTLRHYVVPDYSESASIIEELGQRIGVKNIEKPVDIRGLIADAGGVEPRHRQAHETKPTAPGEDSTRVLQNPESPRAVGPESPRPPTGHGQEMEWAIQDSNLSNPSADERRAMIRLLNRQIDLLERLSGVAVQRSRDERADEHRPNRSEQGTK